MANTLLLTSATENRKCVKCSTSMATSRIQFSRCPDDSCSDSSASRNVSNGMRLHSNSTTNWSSGLVGGTPHRHYFKEDHQGTVARVYESTKWAVYTAINHLR